RCLVAAEVERAHGGDAMAELLEHRPQRLDMLLLARPRRRLEEGELAAQEADALGARLQGCLYLGLRARVREQPDGAAVGGAGRLAPLAPVALGPLGDPGSPVAQARAGVVVGPQPHHAPVGVDTDLVARPRGEHPRAGAGDERDAERT